MFSLILYCAETDNQSECRKQMKYTWQ